jgi:AcrR family transcriptional regulator
VLATALDLVQDHGYPALTIEGLAACAGVAKTTIYRSWPSKAAVVLDAMFVNSDSRLAFPDTGSVEQDMRGQMSQLASLFADPAFSKPYLGLIAASQHDPAVADALRNRLIAPRRTVAANTLRRGVERGELRSDLDLEIAIDALYGPIYYRLLVVHQPITVEYTDTVVNEVFAGLRAESPL